MSKRRDCVGLLERLAEAVVTDEDRQWTIAWLRVISYEQTNVVLECQECTRTNDDITTLPLVSRVPCVSC